MHAPAPSLHHLRLVPSSPTLPDLYLREWDKWGWHKRDDLGSRAGELNNAPPVPRIAAADLSVEEFKTRFLKPQQPVIITGLVDDWPATVCGWQRVPALGLSVVHRAAAHVALAAAHRSTGRRRHYTSTPGIASSSAEKMMTAMPCE